MYMSIFIYSNGCAAFASSVPSNDVSNPVVTGHVGGVVT
jgi:hypothetical protein